MDYRVEHDTLGGVRVPSDRLYGAQTARSLSNFAIGTETVPVEVVRALIVLKRAAAKVNRDLHVLDKERADAIIAACDLLLQNATDDMTINPDYLAEFPLKVWQTGSGTQSNMNVNEVVARLAGRIDPSCAVHPNDHVNRSQSSNDAFPTAMHVAAVCAIRKRLLPQTARMIDILKRLEEENADAIKIGRTHLMDAVPISFAQEISGWRGMIETTRQMIEESLVYVSRLAVGGTAVGTGLNCPDGFDCACAKEISALTGETFLASDNKFHALTSKDAYVHAHGALKALAANLMKIANDVRFLASGPRAGFSEIRIPENEPGSSIMPGKVNPTQCEAATMIAAQVIGNDTTIAVGAAQGNFELNVFLPVLAYNMTQSVRLLADGIRSFTDNCLSGLTADKERMRAYVDRSLMLVTALSPEVGYENAARAARKAHLEGTTLKEAVVALGLLSADEYDEKVRPEKMI